MKVSVTLPTLLAFVGVLGMGICDPCDPCDDGARVGASIVANDATPDSQGDALPAS
jgi:hypothetical protein